MEVHPPHQPLHSWKDFWIHLGTITIGLLIAISLEQSVEALHHLQERHRLEADVREELLANKHRLAYTLHSQAGPRDYMVELKAAIDAQIAGKAAKAPAADDPRRAGAMVMPTMAAWESAKESGTLAFLPSEEIRLYNRFLAQINLWHIAMEAYEDTCLKLTSFEERFRDERGLFDLGDRTSAPSTVGMSAEEKKEYSVLLANTIKSLDRMNRRLEFINLENESLLEGARTEEDLLRRAMAHTGGERYGETDAGAEAPEKR